ncbi:MAG TPA: hypothetical protein PLX06_13995, partial [Fimbriimonadaceae bacterium]|nr:hypothetical protein [Fimbriimonadaceae bacterium]
CRGGNRGSAAGVVDAKCRENDEGRSEDERSRRAICEIQENLAAESVNGRSDGAAVQRWSCESAVPSRGDSVHWPLGWGNDWKGQFGQRTVRRAN